MFGKSLLNAMHGRACEKKKKQTLNKYSTRKTFTFVCRTTVQQGTQHMSTSMSSPSI